MHTNKLIGPALDWAVNHVEGLTGVLAPVNYCKWEHGGPIIEREYMYLEYSGIWRAYCTRNGNSFMSVGATPLIAAMRCYVASKLGDDIEIPEELA
jgi:hypothetical protein